MLGKGFGIVATALYKQEQANEEYDCSKDSAQAETNILTYGVELPNNTPNFFVESHIIIILGNYIELDPNKRKVQPCSAAFLVFTNMYHSF